MYIYSRILQLFGWCNLCVCLIFTIIGYLWPKEMVGGTFLNLVVSSFSTLSLFVIIVLFGVFSFKVGPSKINDLIIFNPINVTFYIVFGVHWMYRLFFFDTGGMENGVSMTSTKLMATIAMELLLNLSVIVTSTNFLKYNKR